MDKLPSEKARVKKTILVLFLHCVIGVIFCILTASVSSLLLFFEIVRLSAINILSLLSVFLGTALACMLSCIHLGKNLFVAIIQAFLSFVMQYIIGILFFGRVFPSENVVWIAMMNLIGGVFSAVLVAFFRESRRRN